MVCGLKAETIQKRILSEADVTLKKAVDVAVEWRMRQSYNSGSKRPPYNKGEKAAAKRQSGCFERDHIKRECLARKKYNKDRKQTHFIDRSSDEIDEDNFLSKSSATCVSVKDRKLRSHVIWIKFNIDGNHLK